MSENAMSSIGADPELFAIDKRGKPYSCIGLLGGSKDYPRYIEDIGVQEDNVMAEFNIPPALSKEQFTYNIMRGIQTVQDVLKPYDLQVSELTTARFSRHSMQDKRCFRTGQ